MGTTGCSSIFLYVFNEVIPLIVSLRDFKEFPLGPSFFASRINGCSMGCGPFSIRPFLDIMGTLSPQNGFYTFFISNPIFELSLELLSIFGIEAQGC